MDCTNSVILVVMTESLAPEKKSKLDLEKLVKANGGKIYQTNTAAPDTICIADRSQLTYQTLIFGANFVKGTVKVASLQKGAKEDIVRPSWLYDCIRQAQTDSGFSGLLVPLEPRFVDQVLS